MTEKRAYARVVQLDEDRFLLTGGSNLGIAHRSTEVYDARTGHTSRGPDLPRPMAKHCAAKVSYDGDSEHLTGHYHK